MKTLLEDVTNAFLGDTRSKPFSDAGGVVIVSGIEELPKWTNTPYLALVDSPTSRVNHYSGRVRKRTFRLQVHVVQKIFDRTGVIMGTLTDLGIDELYKIVIDIFDTNRLNGRYASVFLHQEGQATPLFIGDKKGLQKPLQFEFARYEV